MIEIVKSDKYPGYGFSKGGAVISFKKTGVGYMLTQQLTPKGYRRVFVNHKKIFVHRLVAEVFIPNPHNLPVVNHIDGNKQNNHVSNLEWVSVGENQSHAYRIGLRVQSKGSSHGRSKLTESDIKSIREQRSRGVKITSLARRFNVSPSLISAIALKQIWTHL